MNAPRPERTPIAKARVAALTAAGALFAVWIAANFSRLAGAQNGIVRFPLCALFAVLLLLRPPAASAAGARREPPPWTILAVAIAGLAASIAGLVVNVGQLEWLGVLALLWAILSWALPAPQRRNAPPALLLLVWAHPLPGRLFSPLEFAAQRLSVRGSEWFLHALNVLWAQMLGYIRFQRGGWEMLDALSQMGSAVQYGATNRTPYAVGAEAARQLGRTSRAVELLREGVARFPGDLDLLNNLIYTLAQTPEGIEEALDRIDALLEATRRSVHTLDTASTVYTRAGLLDRADRTLGDILARVEPGSRAWFRARSRSAEVELLRGKAAEAVRSLRELLNQTPRIPEGDLREAHDLLRDAEASAAEAGRTNGPTTP